MDRQNKWWKDRLRSDRHIDRNNKHGWAGVQTYTKELTEIQRNSQTE